MRIRIEVVKYEVGMDLKKEIEINRKSDLLMCRQNQEKEGIKNYFMFG